MRKWVFGSLAAALLLLGALPPLAMPWRCPVNRAAYDRIEVGMTPAQVQAILGGPPGDYRTRLVMTNLKSGGGLPWSVWQGDEGEVWVSFEGGVVRYTAFREAVPSDADLADLVLWRLERLAGRFLP
jgi:hypothetical protein